MGKERAKERRRSERIPVNRAFEGGAPTYVSELSEHGLFLHTEERVPVGTAVKLRFTLLVDDPVVVDAVGTVVRHQDEPSGMGIAFGELSAVTMLRLQDAISRLRPRDSGPPVKASAMGAISKGPVRAKTVRVRPVGAAKSDDRVAGDGAAPEATGDDEVSEDDKTLIRLRPVDMEIVEDDDEAGFFGDGDEEA